MKCTLYLILFFACIQSVRAQDSAFPVPVDGTDCTKQFFRALQEKNVKVLESLMQPDFTTISFNGQQIGGQELRRAVADGLISVDSGILSGASTRRYQDVEVVTGQWDVRASLSNNSFQGVLAFLTVCVKSGGRWQLSVVQFTPMP